MLPANLKLVQLAQCCRLILLVWCHYRRTVLACDLFREKCFVIRLVFGAFTRQTDLYRCIPSELGACQLQHVLTSGTLARFLCFLVQYDTDVTTWSPQGRLFQVEYAMEAVKQGSACVGVTSDTHVVLAALKRTPSELASYQQKVFRIDDHMGIVISGLTADGRSLCKWVLQVSKQGGPSASSLVHTRRRV